MPPAAGTRPSRASVRTESTARVSRFRASSGRGRTRAFIARIARVPAPRGAGPLRDRIRAFMKVRPASPPLRALACSLLLTVAALAGADGAGQPLVVVGRIDTPIHPA